MMVWRTLGISGLLALCTACSSVVPVSYYQLDQQQVTAVAPADTKADLYIEPVQVAAYLNSNSLILQTSAVQLHKSNQHQWAEALDLQLQRGLVNTLSNELPNWQVQTLQATPQSCRLLVQLDKFHGDQQGTVQLAGRYHLLCGDKVKSAGFASSQPQPDEGYPAMVSTLSRLWQQQIRQIAQTIQIPAQP